MTSTVVTTGEARDRLSQIAASFDAGDTEPVVFGSHRRPQAVILPFTVWERLLADAEDDIDRNLAQQRLSHKSPRLSTGEVLNKLAELRASREDTTDQ